MNLSKLPGLNNAQYRLYKQSTGFLKLKIAWMKRNPDTHDAAVALEDRSRASLDMSDRIASVRKSIHIQAQNLSAYKTRREWAEATVQHLQSLDDWIKAYRNRQALGQCLCIDDIPLEHANLGERLQWINRKVVKHKFVYRKLRSLLKDIDEMIERCSQELREGVAK